MNHDLMKTIINSKIEIVQDIIRHLPPEVAEPLEQQSYEFVKDLNDVLTEYLEQKKMPAQEQGKIRKVPVE